MLALWSSPKIHDIFGRVGKNKYSEARLTDTIARFLLFTEFSPSKWMVYFDIELTRTRKLAREQNEKYSIRNSADYLLGNTVACREHDQE